jgi:acyl-CoA synthetase (AMP-forming)/AMP-acid ligase II
MSTRNSVEGICFMLESTSCRRIVAHPINSPLIQQVQADMTKKGIELQVDVLPALHDVFPSLSGSSEALETVPYPASEKAIDLNDHCLYIHSSGSTGLPKSVHFTYIRTLQWMRTSTCYHLPDETIISQSNSIDVYGNSQDVRFGAMGLPSFHAIGLQLQLTYPLAMGRGVVVYTPQYPDPPILAHAQSVYEVSKMAGCNGIFAIPAFIEVCKFYFVKSR